MQDEWVLASIIINRLAQVTGDTAEFVGSELITLLQAGTIRGRRVGVCDVIPPECWISLSKTGSAVIRFGALPIPSRHRVELRYEDVLLNWPELAGIILTAEPEARVEPTAEPETPASGRGRRSSRHIFIPEFYRRHRAGDRHGSLGEWGRVLARWMLEEHPNAPKADKRTISNHLSKENLPHSIMRDL